MLVIILSLGLFFFSGLFPEYGQEWKPVSLDNFENEIELLKSSTAKGVFGSALTGSTNRGRYELVDENSYFADNSGKDNHWEYRGDLITMTVVYENKRGS